MSPQGWVMAGVQGALVFGLISAAACVGCSEDREPQAAVADGGVAEGAEAPAVDGSVADTAIKKSPQKRHSLAVSGWGRHSLHDFTMKDKQGREVVRLKSISGTTDVDALKRGMFHVKNAKIEGVELTLYRDDSGKLSLVNALKQQPPTVRHGMMVPPTEKQKKGERVADGGRADRS
jgi:hypothetical protein